MLFLAYAFALIPGEMDPGDKARITSPFHNFTASATVTFKTKLSTAEYDVLPKIKVFRKSQSGFQKDPLLVIKKTWR